MIRADGYNPLRWDCERQGCFNLKRRPKIEVFADCFPGREIVPVDCLELVWGLGTLHCISQQQPAAGKRSPS